MKNSKPFRMLELQIRYQNLEEEWDKLKEEYSKDETVTSDEQYTERLIKLTAEKIKILSEINTMKAEA
jgi:ABC-type phosphate transport system auxiliary subunit